MLIIAPTLSENTIGPSTLRLISPLSLKIPTKTIFRLAEGCIQHTSYILDEQRSMAGHILLLCTNCAIVCACCTRIVYTKLTGSMWYKLPNTQSITV